jgi:hypothetical protein
MTSTWVRSAVVLLTCLLLACSRGGKLNAPNGPGAAGEQAGPTAPEEVVAALEQAGASFRRAEDRPGKPVVAVYFTDATINDPSLALLKRLPNLNTLGLRGCRLPNEGIKEVAALSRLQKLYLSDCPWVTDTDLKELTSLKRLKELVLTGCTRVTDSGLKDVAAFAQLQLLELSECRQISDAGLKELASLQRLQRLGLSGCDKVTAAGEKELKTALPKCAITREPYDFTRTGVR